MTDLAISAITNTQAAVSAESASLQAGYNVSLTDLSSFESSLAAADSQLVAQVNNVEPPSEAALLVTEPLEHINTEAAEIRNYANEAAASDNELTPGEMIMLTVRSQEFMFHCQLTSNVANRASDGLQQLFRQQG